MAKCGIPSAGPSSTCERVAAPARTSANSAVPADRTKPFGDPAIHPPPRVEHSTRNDDSIIKSWKEIPMRLFALSLTILLAVACAGDPQPPADEAAGPAATAPVHTDAVEPIDLRGDARLVKLVSPEWERVEEFTKLFYDGELEQLYANFSAAYQEEFSLQDLTTLRDGMLAELGEEVEVVKTRKEEKQGYQAFFREARFSGDERLIEVAFLIGPNQTISGLFVTPERSAPPAGQ
jgi:hypothetical protein